MKRCGCAAAGVLLAGCVGSGPPPIQAEDWMHGALMRGCAGTFDAPPEFVAGQAPYVPKVADVARRSALALISLTIPVDGEPTAVQVQSDDGKFYVASTEAAVRTWRFKPALSKGQPVAVRCKIGFAFDVDPRGMPHLPIGPR